MDAELEAAIKKARHHKMSAREKFEQRVSFVYGQQDHDKPGKSKDEIRQMLADSGGWPLAEMAELTTLRTQVSEIRADLEVILEAAEPMRMKEEMDCLYGITHRNPIQKAMSRCRAILKGES